MVREVGVESGAKEMHSRVSKEYTPMHASEKGDARVAEVVAGLSDRSTLFWRRCSCRSRVRCAFSIINLVGDRREVAIVLSRRLFAVRKARSDHV
jgi:hypothetical protein